MSISNLKCTRTGEGILLTWTWTTDSNSERVHVTVTRLIDEILTGDEVDRTPLCDMDVSVRRYDTYMAGTPQGMKVNCGRIPVRVIVEGKDETLELEMNDCGYEIDWRLVETVQEIPGPRRAFGRRGPSTYLTRRYLELNIPQLPFLPETLLGCNIGRRAVYFPSLQVGLNRFAIASPEGSVAVAPFLNKELAVSRMFTLKNCTQR